MSIKKPEINTFDKKFKNGDATTGQEGTIVTATWLNDVQKAISDLEDNKLDSNNEQKVTLSSSITSAATDVAASSKAASILNKKINDHKELYDDSKFNRGFLTTQNLDTILTAGNYGQGSSAEALISRNYPEKEAGSLVVLNSAYLVQHIYYPFNSSVFYKRNRNSSGTFSNWEKIGLLSDSVTSKDAKTGASSKAVNTAYLKSVAAEQKADRALEDYQKITVGGDANTYYPVLISSEINFNHNSLFNYSISRNYNSRAPAAWNPDLPTHPGGLNFSFSATMDTVWGGNDKYTYVNRIGETYSTMLAKIGLYRMGFVAWLRGGGADYFIKSASKNNDVVTVKLETFTENGQTFSPMAYPSSEMEWGPFFDKENSWLGVSQAREIAESALSSANQKSTVAVLTGTATNGVYLPIPAGYTQAQCKFFVSPNYQGLHNDLYNITCKLINTRQVILAAAGEPYGSLTNIANYFVMGVK